MAYFAQLDSSNTVTQVIVVDDSWVENGEQGGIDFCINHSGHALWKQTWLDNSGPTKNYAGIGHTYDPVRNAFLTKKPFNSFVLNEDTCMWEAPVPKPSDETKLFYWKEEILSWVEETGNYVIEEGKVRWL